MVRFQNVKLGSITTADDGNSRFDIILSGTSAVYTLRHDSVIDLTRWQQNLSQLIVDIGWLTSLL